MADERITGFISTDLAPDFVHPQRAWKKPFKSTRDMRTWRQNGEKLAAWHRVKSPPDRSTPVVHNPNSTLPIHQNLPWSITSTDSRQCIVIIFGLHHFTIHSQEELLQIKKRPRPQPQSLRKSFFSIRKKPACTDWVTKEYTSIDSR